MAQRMKGGDASISDREKGNLYHKYICVGKDVVYVGFRTIYPWFQASTGGLGFIT
jgi:hypothetical protein